VLQELRISGLGVIEDATLEPHPGLTVVTGETGAGKTMIVAALDLVTGGRGAAARVRTGSDRAVVEARFAVPADGPSAETARAAGGDLDEDGSLLVLRSVGADGRSRAHVGGRLAPVGTLAKLAEPLVAVHGQGEAAALHQPARQRAVLDRFAGAEGAVAEYRALREQWLTLRRDLADRRTRTRERAQREHLLRLGVAEIRATAPQPGEDAALVDEVRRLENADALRAAAQAARVALVGSGELPDEPTAAALVAAALRSVRAGGDPRLAALAGELAEATALLADVGSSLAAFLSDLDADPDLLAALLHRRAALRALTRRYAEDVDGVLAWADEAERELAELDSSEDRLAELHAQLHRVTDALTAAAARLSALRRAAAERLGAAVTAELEQLAMPRASVNVAVTRRRTRADADDAVVLDGEAVAAGVDGVDQVEIMMTAHPGAPELPIARGASGGELSRVMLALEVALAGADPVSTLVFDEVDAGVGGRAATEIAARLTALAADHQVIVVTHLAQVAARADRHFVVHAGFDGQVAASDVCQVTGGTREIELARMLAGEAGPRARAHARDLLGVPSSGSGLRRAERRRAG
jgi:DNA repair protein RecN (Recombination protein N)